MGAATHPIWTLLERITFMAFLFACMAWFAGDLSDFTELKSFIAMGLGFAGREWWQGRTAHAAATVTNTMATD